MKAQYNFKRIEKKYLITTYQYEAFMMEVNQHLKDDAYTSFTVNNIYFDTDDDYLIRRSISKPLYKEKLRLRGYNDVEDDQAFLEIKKKYNKVVYKRRVNVNINELGDDLDLSQSENQISKELEFFIDRYDPKPKYYLGYKRQAYVGVNEPGLRITIDNDITYRFDDLNLKSGLYGKKLLDEDQLIMEIKTDKAMPLWLVKALNDNKIYPTSYSKVGNVYTKELIESRG